MYILNISNQNGNYGNPQSYNFDGSVFLPDEFLQSYLDANGFVNITVEDGVVTSVEKNEEAWKAWKATLPPESDPLVQAKSERIAQSKTDLETYLLEHPLQWTDGQYYAITAEKQNQLTSKIMAATMAQTMSTDYTLTWNSTGEVCKEWALPDLYALAFSIDARVTALVTYQQTKEVAMRNAETMEELEAITVNYDEVE